MKSSVVTGTISSIQGETVLENVMTGTGYRLVERPLSFEN